MQLSKLNDPRHDHHAHSVHVVCTFSASVRCRLPYRAFGIRKREKEAGATLVFAAVVITRGGRIIVMATSCAICPARATASRVDRWCRLQPNPHRALHSARPKSTSRTFSCAFIWLIHTKKLLQRLIPCDAHTHVEKREESPGPPVRKP